MIVLCMLEHIGPMYAVMSNLYDHTAAPKPVLLVASTDIADSSTTPLLPLTSLPLITQSPPHGNAPSKTHRACCESYERPVALQDDLHSAKGQGRFVYYPLNTINPELHLKGHSNVLNLTTFDPHNGDEKIPPPHLLTSN